MWFFKVSLFMIVFLTNGSIMNGDFPVQQLNLSEEMANKEESITSFAIVDLASAASSSNIASSLSTTLVSVPSTTSTTSSSLVSSSLSSILTSTSSSSSSLSSSLSSILTSTSSSSSSLSTSLSSILTSTASLSSSSLPSWPSSSSSPSPSTSSLSSVSPASSLTPSLLSSASIVSSSLPSSTLQPTSLPSSISSSLWHTTSAATSSSSFFSTSPSLSMSSAKSTVAQTSSATFLSSIPSGDSTTNPATSITLPVSTLTTTDAIISTVSATIMVNSSTLSTTTTCAPGYIEWGTNVTTATSFSVYTEQVGNIVILNVTLTNITSLECDNTTGNVTTEMNLITVTDLHPYREYNLSIAYFDACTNSTMEQWIQFSTYASEYGPDTSITLANYSTTSTSISFTAVWSCNECNNEYTCLSFIGNYSSLTYTASPNFTIINCNESSFEISMESLQPNRNYSIFSIFCWNDPMQCGDLNFVGNIPTDSGVIPVEKTLSAGAIAGIVVGVLVFIGLLIFLAYLTFTCYEAKKKQKIKDTNIEVSNFLNKLKYFADRSWIDLIMEFENIDKSVIHDQNVALTEANMSRNRYTNILPYDYNRVILMDQECDYINASYIDGFNRTKEYIATQGPMDEEDVNLRSKKHTVADFWTMIWQQHVKCIIMLTSLQESGRTKSACYWPPLNESRTWGSTKVKLLEETDNGHFVVRKIHLRQKKENRFVIHYQYVNWSDMKATDEEDLLHFLKTVRTSGDMNKNPVVIHCSAGVGRTGTFIALDILLQQLEHGIRTINIFHCSSKLRQQRILMGQVDKQYILIYKCVGRAIEEMTVKEMLPRPSDENIAQTSYDNENFINSSKF